MAFKFRCPKCGSTTYNVERDNRVFTPNRTYELIFSCRCGKQLFGDQIEEEVARQMKLQKVDEADRVLSRPASVPSESPMLRSGPKSPAVEPAPGAEVAPAAAARVAEERPREQAERRGAVEGQAPPPHYQRSHHEPYGEVYADSDGNLWLPDHHPQKCEWGPCHKAVRNHSKYCSRNCSNKNARWRHKQRKHSKRVAA